MEIEQIKELMVCLEKSKLSKLFFKKGDIEIRLEKELEQVRYLPSKGTHSEVSIGPLFHPETPLQGERGGSIRREESRVSAGTFVTSPMVGTFYSAPASDQPSFVKVGDQVSEQTVLCIIEAMKVMNEVKAGVSGTIVEVLVENGQPVEFGTRLFRVQ